jgi:hypothetical protein
MIDPIRQQQKHIFIVWLMIILHFHVDARNKFASDNLLTLFAFCLAAAADDSSMHACMIYARVLMAMIYVCMSVDSDLLY